MSNLEPRIEAVREQYGLAASDFWKIKQNGQWVCKHAALEVVAVKAKIEWLPPQIIEADAPQLVTSMIVTGKMGDRIEWATGETNPTNYSVVGRQPAYPWAMSEKRAKDRVILKLVGIHGLVYSDAEIGDETAPAQEQPLNDGRTRDQRSEQGRRQLEADKTPTSAAEMKRGLEQIDQDLVDCHAIGDVDKCAKIWAAIMKRDGWSKDYIDCAKPKFAARRDAINKAGSVDDIFPGDAKTNSYVQNLGAM